MRKIFLLVTALVFTFQTRVLADEGMWLLSLIKQVNMDEIGVLVILGQKGQRNPKG